MRKRDGSIADLFLPGNTDPECSQLQTESILPNLLLNRRMDDALIESLKTAFHKDDAAAVRSLLTRNPELKRFVHAPIGPFESPAICNVRSDGMLDVLLDAGADINAKSQWWAGGFCLLDHANDALAQYAIQRGAKVEVNAAARLGLLDRLRELVLAKPDLVNAPGGDGQRPLHVARNVEIAQFLIDHGAEIDARDVDHESTPAQYHIAERQDIVRMLIRHGAKTDIFMAAALGDAALVTQHLDANPDCVRHRVGSQTFPMVNPRAGGTIYNWTLGVGTSPHQAAMRFKRDAVVNLLMDRSRPEVQLINRCWLSDASGVKRLLTEYPGLVEQLPATDRRAVADAARERNWSALRLFLETGFPVDARGQHEGTALHWSAWHGNRAAVAELLERGAEIELRDADHQATPLEWTLHASESGWCRDEGDYPAVATLLIKAGAKIPTKVSGTPETQAAVRAIQASR